MSSIKERMHESVGLSISFECPNCGALVEDEVKDASFDWSADSSADGTGTSDSVVVCPTCEHEETVYVIAQGIGKIVVLRDARGVTVSFRDNSFDDIGYDSALDEYTPYDAAEVFDISMRELAALSGPANHVLLKMIYLQSIIALEAYLSDRLIKMILDDRKKLVDLVKRTTKFKSTQVTIEQLADDKDYLKNFVKNYLHEFSFHKLRETARFYKAVLNVDIFKNAVEATELDAIVVKRHHIVHRNGRDNEDKQIAISVSEVERVQLLVREMVERIQIAFVEYKRKKRSEEMELEIKRFDEMEKYQNIPPREV